MEKRCSKCKELKDENKFRRKPHLRDGLDYVCSDCLKRPPRRLPDLETVIASLQNTEDEAFAYQAFLFQNCKCDDDYEKPEYSLETFRAMVRNFLVARRQRYEARLAN